MKNRQGWKTLKPGTHFKRGQRKRILVEMTDDYVAFRYPSSKKIQKEDTEKFLEWIKDARVKPR